MVNDEICLLTSTIQFVHTMTSEFIVNNVVTYVLGVVVIAAMLIPLAFIPAGATLVAKTSSESCSPTNDTFMDDEQCQPTRRRTGLGLLITGCVLFVPVAYLWYRLLRNVYDPSRIYPSLR